MNITFRQGIIRYPGVGLTQTFLNYVGGNVDLIITPLPQNTNRVEVTFAHRDQNYLFTELQSVTAAWTGPFAPTTDYWLYWDIDRFTGLRTFGYTILAPTFGSSAPPAINGQHWFNTADMTMRVYSSSSWKEVIRVFAARLNTAALFPLGSNLSHPYGGTQVGVTGTFEAGRIVYDETSRPLLRDNGTLFTTLKQIFVNGASVNAIKLEANILQAEAIENIAAYHVVKWTDFNKVGLAGYNDLNETAIGMMTQGITLGNVGPVVTQGVVTNPMWTWPTAGAPLWALTTGQLTDTDPHIVSVLTYPKKKPPIARVLSPTTIFFDQGLGGMGEVGDQGPPGVATPATTTQIGVVRLSVASPTPGSPIVVGDNDPRLIGAPFAPLLHTHSATDITVTPGTGFIGPNAQLALQQIDSGKVNRSGDTMTGFLSLVGAPTAPLHAATKAYVDGVVPAVDTLTNTTFLNGLNQIAVNLTTLNGEYLRINGANSMVANLNVGTNRIINVVNPINPQDAATKSYVDALSSNLNDILSADGTATLTNANYAQMWNWQLTGNTTAFTIGETAASTGINNTLFKTQGIVGTTAELFNVSLGTSNLIQVTNNGAVNITAATDQTVVVSAGSGPAPGDLVLEAGDSTSVAEGGDVQITAGNGLTPGDVDIVAGNATPTGKGGDITLSSGSSLDGDGGNIRIQTAAGVSPGVANGGLIEIIAGNGTTTGAGGSLLLAAGTGLNSGVVTLRTNSINRLVIDGDGSWSVDGLSGTTGQVLMSTGATTSPAWTDMTLPYDIALYASGTMQPDGTNLSGMLLTRDVFIANTATHNAYVLIAPTNIAYYEIIRIVTTPFSETVIGTVTFPAATKIGVVSIPTSVTLDVGDLVVLRANTLTLDLTLSDVFVTLTGCALATPCSVGP